MARKNNEYFDGFVRLVEHSNKAAEFLYATLKSFDPEQLSGCMESLHDIEHTADGEKHELMKKLVKEFVTPIEREDIIRLTDTIDDVTDSIEDVLLRIYMYNLTTMRPEALEFTQLISRCCEALRIVMHELPNFHKSTSLHQAVIDVNTLEEEGDDLYVRAMRRLFTETADPAELVAWSQTFERLEECCDACEEVASVVETIMMKNS